MQRHLRGTQVAYLMRVRRVSAPMLAPVTVRRGVSGVVLELKHCVEVTKKIIARA